MTRYEHENIKHFIDGYITRTNASESRESQFERAKAELIMNRKRELALIEGFTLNDMTRVVS